jgi:acyl carrier protein
MTRDQIRTEIANALSTVAPEVDAAGLPPDEPFRQAIDLDSMDFLNFVVALHKALGVDVPETDYGKLATMNQAIDYLSARLRP